MKLNFLENKKTIITSLIVATLALILVFFIYFYYGQKEIASNDTTSKNIYPPKTSDRTGTPGNSTNITGSALTPSPQVESTKVEKGGVLISSPIAGASIEPGKTIVSGTVNSSAGGDLYYMVKGASTGVLVDNKVQAIAPGSAGTAYRFTLSFDNLPKGSDSAVLEVYLMNGSDKIGYADVGVKV